MVNKEMAEAITEVNVILDRLPSDMINKIPNEIKEFFKNNASSTYVFEYDEMESLSNQNLKFKTKGIIAFLYKEYLCDTYKKEEYMKIYNEFLKKCEREKVDFVPDKIFIEPKAYSGKMEMMPTLNKKNSWYKKVLKFIEGIFKK